MLGFPKHPVRTGVGRYRVTFNNLGAHLPPNVGGHVQVNAVGTSNAYCSAYNASTGGTPNLSVDVRCFAGRTGAPVDRRFTVLFVLPADTIRCSSAPGDATSAG